MNKEFEMQTSSMLTGQMHKKLHFVMILNSFTKYAL